MTDFVDNDPQETQEWLDSLESIIEVEGGNKAHHILEKLIDMARRSGINLPYSANTAYEIPFLSISNSVSQVIQRWNIN